jgi:hypothetical protein
MELDEVEYSIKITEGALKEESKMRRKINLSHNFSNTKQEGENQAF